MTSLIPLLWRHYHLYYDVTNPSTIPLDSPHLYALGCYVHSPHYVSLVPLCFTCSHFNNQKVRVFTSSLFSPMALFIIQCIVGVIILHLLVTSSPPSQFKIMIYHSKAQFVYKNYRYPPPRCLLTSLTFLYDDTHLSIWRHAPFYMTFLYDVTVQLPVFSPRMSPILHRGTECAFTSPSDVILQIGAHEVLFDEHVFDEHVFNRMSDLRYCCKAKLFFFTIPKFKKILRA